MRITPYKLLLTAAFSFAVACTPGEGGDGGAPECESDLDCEDSDQCHPGLGVCVQDCTLDTADACPAEAPVCNEADDDGSYPLEVADPDADQAFRLLCVCVEDSDCGADEICDPDIRECVPGESTADECVDDTDCGEDELCIDGGCEAFCDDYACAADGDLCRLDDAAPDFNQCVIAESETAWCADADDAPAQSGPPHIVVYAHEAGPTSANACGENGDLTLRAFFFDVLAGTEITVDDIHRANFDAGGDRFFNHATDTEVDDLEDGDYLVTVYVCGNPNDIALYIDTGDAVSNAYCFDATP